eukprot:Pgem_evm1s4003
MTLLYIVVLISIFIRYQYQGDVSEDPGHRPCNACMGSTSKLFQITCCNFKLYIQSFDW